MGMVSRAEESATGRIVQFKTGHDGYQLFKVGDTIPWSPVFNPPDQGIDGQYEAWWEDAPDTEPGPQYWVIVVNSKLHAVLRMDETSDKDLKSFNYVKPDPGLWSQERRDEYQELKNKINKEIDEFELGIKDLHPTERHAARLRKLVGRIVDYTNIGRKAFGVEPLEDPSFYDRF